MLTLRRRTWVLRCGSGLAACLTLGGLGCARPGAKRPLSVFAASSLTEAFEALAAAYEVEPPGGEVQLNLAGSQVLRLQIEQGAPAEVFASASPRHMDALVAAGLVESPRIFARNELALIVPADGSSPVKGFESLGRAQRLVLGAAEVPIGDYTRQMLARAQLRYGATFVADVREATVSEEPNVRLVRAKVELGEADAAIVYRSDVVGTDRVEALEIPDAVQVRADYPIAAVTRTKAGKLEEARRFVDFVMSSSGQSILRSYGLGPPASGGQP